MNEYVKTEWVDNDAPALSAANLNHIESGIEAVTNAVIALHNAGVSPEQITATITEAVRSKVPQRAADLELETDAGFVTPKDVYKIVDKIILEDNALRMDNGKLIYTDIDGNDHVL